jgi:hypothetical protein
VLDKLQRDADRARTAPSSIVSAKTPFAVAVPNVPGGTLSGYAGRIEARTLSDRMFCHRFTYEEVERVQS